MLTIFGVDPGFAGQGIAVLEQRDPESEIHVLFASSTKTEKRANKRKRDLRVSADDQRRYKEQWHGLEVARLAVADRTINALAIEVYTPYKEATSAAAKAGAAYGGATYWGLSLGYVILPLVPQDLKRGVCGKVSASKQAVQDRIGELVPQMKQWLARVNKTEREHMADAAAAAYVGFTEMWELKKMLGSTTSTPGQQLAF